MPGLLRLPAVTRLPIGPIPCLPLLPAVTRTTLQCPSVMPLERCLRGVEGQVPHSLLPMAVYFMSIIDILQVKDPL